MSKDSDAFVDWLKGAYQFMGKEAMELYRRKLAKWNLKASQWEAAFDTIVNNSDDSKVPDLNSIYTELKKQSRAILSKYPMGWACFERDKHSHAIRIYRDDVWRIYDMTKDCGRNEVTHLQPNYGEPLSRHMPGDADDFRIIPDEVYIPPDEVIRQELEMPCK